MFKPKKTATTNEHFDQNGEMCDPHMAAVKFSLTFCVYLVLTVN